MFTYKSELISYCSDKILWWWFVDNAVLYYDKLLNETTDVPYHLSMMLFKPDTSYKVQNWQ